MLSLGDGTGTLGVLQLCRAVGAELMGAGRESQVPHCTEPARGPAGTAGRWLGLAGPGRAPAVGIPLCAMHLPLPPSLTPAKLGQVLALQELGDGGGNSRDLPGGLG